MERTSTVVGIDADDTLWKNEEYFRATEDRFVELTAASCDLDPAEISARLLDMERAHVGIYGYGVKGFTLSMIETAHTLTNGTIRSAALREIVDLGKQLLRMPVELLDGVGDALADLGANYPLVLITKGDLVHQQNKIDESGLASLFVDTHIVADKTPAAYGEVLALHDVNPADFVMVGNSVRSDVLPVIELGGRGVHVPYRITWAAEVVEEPTETFPVIASLGELRPLLESQDS